MKTAFASHEVASGATRCGVGAPSGYIGPMRGNCARRRRTAAYYKWIVYHRSLGYFPRRFVRRRPSRNLNNKPPQMCCCSLRRHRSIDEANGVIFGGERGSRQPPYILWRSRSCAVGKGDFRQAANLSAGWLTTSCRSLSLCFSSFRRDTLIVGGAAGSCLVYVSGIDPVLRF